MPLYCFRYGSGINHAINKMKFYASSVRIHSSCPDGLFLPSFSNVHALSLVETPQTALSPKTNFGRRNMGFWCTNRYYYEEREETKAWLTQKTGKFHYFP